ncbi:outer membrane protein assembly factor BamC [Rhodoferax sp.]|uniref:outer membrane protein assembly factor BamC n=1 Tax=Rhodoferax sp. TaxID=50421 RepID=UPI00261806CD|nr:outer membrane protein assembly factor BamC [Rhodoferax sp.]MDD2918297.1 outer membrane protein assembly factor BamC [Rhodoferax sp.]
MNPISRLALLGLTLTLGACTVLEGDKVNYKSAGKAPSLEVPPDLTQLSRETRYVVPGSAVTASSFQIGQTSSQTTPTATSSLGDVRIERAGTQRWLVISRPADKLWEPVKDFWLENGFLLVMEQANLGIMETDWAENRAKIPQDIIRSTIGKVFDSLYSTGERDKFRTRLERNASGGTEIFISHRGMVEVFNSTAKDQTVWQPRAADPELEAEFLRRLMVKLGVSQEQSKALIAAGTATQGARLDTVNGQPVVRLDDNFDRAWRRVGLALDRTNFTVEDRDRSKGVYFVRYVAPSADKTEPGFFGKLFGSSTKDSALQKFKVSVVSQDSTSLVSVQNADGSPAAAADAQRIVKVLAEDLK